MKLIQKIHWLFLILLATSCGNKQIVSADYAAVIPLPQTITAMDGNPFLLNAKTAIVYTAGNETQQKTAQFLSEYLAQITGEKLKVTDVQPTDNYILLQTGYKADTDEAYSLAVNDKSIVIDGAGESGIFYGVQTLRKSIQVGESLPSFPSVKIEDAPRFKYRGMMLDVSRHFASVDFVKKYIDLLALHNINNFHMHLTDDQGWRIEIKKYPKLTEIGSTRKETIKGFYSSEYDGKPHGGYYTQDELKAIVNYAQERFINVVPEVDLPGHMLAALASYPELGCTGGPYEVSPKWGINSEVLCGGNDQTLVFLKDVFTELIEIFPSEYIHIGGDECPKKEWEKCPKCQAKIKQLGIKADKDHTAENRLQTYMATSLEKFLNERGRKLIGWDEILEGGLSPNATVMSWRGVKGGTEAAKQNHDVIMTPTSHLYFDYYQTEYTKNQKTAFPAVNSLEEVYTFDAVPADLTPEQAKHIIGLQGNLWRELITTPEHTEFMVLPRMAALAESQWVKPETKDYAKFVHRLKNFTRLYDKLGYTYATYAFDIAAEIEPDVQSKAVKVSLSTFDDAPIYYTLDGSEPTAESTKYAEPLLLTSTTDLKAIGYRGTEKTATYNEHIDINKATLAKYKLVSEASKYFTSSFDKTALTDGLRGNGVHIFGGGTTWVGFSGKMDVDFDLAKETEVAEVVVGTIMVPNSGDVQYVISVSSDGSAFTTVYDQMIKPTSQDLKATFDKVKARYVKVEIRSINYGHILVDEVFIN